MRREPVHAARNEGGTTQAVHRPLHDRGVPDHVFPLRAPRYASHARNRSMTPEGGEFIVLGRSSAKSRSLRSLKIGREYWMKFELWRSREVTAGGMHNVRPGWAN